MESVYLFLMRLWSRPLLLNPSENDLGSDSDTREDPNHGPSSTTTSLAVEEPSSTIKVLLPAPFIPASQCEPERPCPPLPSFFPPVPVNETPMEVAAADVKTPDEWVKRNPQLLRLTGKHPFNTEPPLTTLFDAGFLTPAHLHFVRNHGAVPNVDEARLRDWRIRVHGLVQRECSFSIEELKEKFQVVTLPVTLCCAGNRRKEQNIVRKSLGFSWGPAGVSTALWTGVYLADVLDYVKPTPRKAKHVIFEGADELPKGPYGTSQRISLASKRDRGMLIAWAMNGLPLEPDHGFPVRMVIPGQIGGRMVKWLTRIEISDQESQHHLHFWDNKVLPMQLTPEQARSEPKWWYDPRYLITELSVNSAIVKPAHDEVLDLSSGDEAEMYTLRGYAYSGGGRRINRVEITLDGGKTWTLAEIDYPEDLYREYCHEDSIYGTLDLTDKDTCFCWCFWKFEVPIPKLAAASMIAVRAMDQGHATQPRDMYLNATSMLNNWWFRVAILKDQGDGKQLRFEHPTLPNTPGGWMERLKAAGKDILNPVFEESTSVEAEVPVPVAAAPEVCMTNPEIKRQITLEELKGQDRNKPWFVVNGEVYDGTEYMSLHPGGADSILLAAGEDASDDFLAIHSIDGRQKLAQFHIGTLVGKVDQPTAADLPDDPSQGFLHPKVWKGVKLAEVRQVSHDSFRFKFTLARPDRPFGLPTGQHVFLRIKRKDTGETVQRAFTPISKEDLLGTLELLIKVYYPSAAFPEGGKMTMGMLQLSIGDEIDMKGPLGSFIWKGKGTAMWRGVERHITELGMVCGGSGITPIFQVMRQILEDPEDKETRIWVLNTNKTEQDILLREEIESLIAEFSKDRVQVYNTLSTVPEGWKEGSGRMNEKMMREHLPAPSPTGLILTCGPDGMISGAVKPGMRALGWNPDESLVIF